MGESTADGGDNMRSIVMKLGLVALVPLLMAPNCKTIHPNYPSNPEPPGTFRDKQATVEPKLVEAGADSLLALGITNWNLLEPCNACVGTNCNGIAWPPGPSQERHTETNAAGTQSWRCNFYMENLDAYLDTHADAFGTRTARRHFMVQLAPIFFNAAVFPPYLNGVAFNHTTFRDKYRRLWDKVRPVIEEHRQDSQFGRWPYVAIGLGNEINAYLNANNPTVNWPAYKQFVHDAVAYIKPTIANAWTSATVQWYGACGPGECIHQGTCCWNSDQGFQVMSETDLKAYTYYPPLNLDSTTLQTRITDDFNWMTLISADAQKSTLVQETGYPTSGASSTQLTFVNKLFTEWANHYDWIAGVNYFSVHDFPTCPAPVCFMPTGFFTNSGTNKSTSNWNNFKTKMAAVPD